MIHARRERASRNDTHRGGRHQTETPSQAADTTTADVLLGDTKVESHAEVLASGSSRAFRFQATASGAIHAVEVYVGSHGSPGGVGVGIYSDLDGRPGALLSSGQAASTSLGTWNTVAASTGELVEGDTYWLAILAGDSAIHLRDRAHGSCPSMPGARGNLGTLPELWRGDVVSRACPVSAYVTAEDPTSPIDPIAPTEPIPPVTPTEPVAPTGPPTPSAPANTSPPTITGTTTVGQVLSAGPGDWANEPQHYAYQWQECDASGHRCHAIEGAVDSSLALVESIVGHRLRVAVTATNAGGSGSAESALTAEISPAPVTEPPPAQPVSPVNDSLPAITGSAVEGQTLKAATGSWSGEPTAYAYRWEDCSIVSLLCTEIAGATESSYTLRESDVGHSIRVSVTASNAAGEATAVSQATAAVSAHSSEPNPKGCFSDPEACNYPGPNATGVANCSALARAAGTTISRAGETVEGKDFDGPVVINAPNVTLNNDCVEVNAGESVGSTAVQLEASADNFKITNSTVRGLNTTSESIEAALRNNHQDSGDLADNVRMENCGTCIYYAWTVENSYVDNNGLLNLDESMVNHAEDWYLSNSTIVANHDTLLNPSKQAAVIFAAVGNDTPCNNHETVTNSLLAGGGYVFYFCAHSSGNAGSTIDIANNRFARMVCAKAEESGYEGRGGFGCTGNPKGYFEDGEGSGGFFPRVGFFGIVAEKEEPDETNIYERGRGWSGNYLDDNLEPVSEQADPGS